MMHRTRRVGAVVLSIGCMCSVAACGSSAKSGSGSSGSGSSGHFSPVGFKLTSTQRSCLKKKGVTIPTGGYGHPGAGANFKHGKFPKGKFPRGKFPKGKFRRGEFPKGANGQPPAGFAAQFAKRRAAFKACGVTFPSRPSPGRAPSSTTG